MFVSSVLAPFRTEMCDEVEAVSSVLNICCCVVHCESQTVAVLSVYRSPSTCKRQLWLIWRLSLLFCHLQLTHLLWQEILILIYFLMITTALHILICYLIFISPNMLLVQAMLLTKFYIN